MYLLLHLAALTVTVLALARIFPSVKIRSVGAAIVVAIVFSVLNFFLGWLIRVALFVPAILTLGVLFLFVPFIVNTVLLWLTDKLLRSFEIETLGGLLASAAIITLVNGVFNFTIGAHSHMAGMHSMYGPGPTRWI
jgi:putative membrane protein